MAPLASYAGDVPGLAATSPEAIGALRLEARSTASQRYLASMDRRLSDFEQAALLQIPQTRVTAHFGVHIGSQELLLSVCPPSASRPIMCGIGSQSIWVSLLEARPMEKSTVSYAADELAPLDNYLAAQQYSLGQAAHRATLIDGVVDVLVQNRRR